MAKGKKKNNKQGLVSKALNAGLIALGFSRVIQILFSPVTMESKFALIVQDATFGLASGEFNLGAGLRMYTPAGAAIALGAMKRHLMKSFPVRG